MAKHGQTPKLPDSGLELLLGYDGRIHSLPDGYQMRFKISRTDPTDERPHGLSYAFTLHDRYNRRVLGYDNAHAPHSSGKRKPKSKRFDHWHRDANDRGRAYDFVDAATLLKDFFDECEQYLQVQGIEFDVLEDKFAEGGRDD